MIEKCRRSRKLLFETELYESFPEVILNKKCRWPRKLLSEAELYESYSEEILLVRF